MENELTTIQPTEAVLAQDGNHDARLIDLWLHGRSRATQRGYRAEAERFMTHVSKPLRQVSLADLQGYADALDAAGLQPATRRRMLAAVKSLFAWAHGLGYLPYDTAKPLRLPPLRDTLAERVIDESALLRMIDLEPSARNAAMLALMYAAGLRASELVSLRWRDCQSRANGQGQVCVLGKGSKTRTILIPASVFTRVMLLRNGADDDAFVFASRKAGGPLNTSHLLKITKRAARRAGLTRNVRNHDFRHSHCTHSLERGAPIHLVQQTAGHSSISTTGKYLAARPGDSSSRYLGL